MPTWSELPSCTPFSSGQSKKIIIPDFGVDLPSSHWPLFLNQSSRYQCVEPFKPVSAGQPILGAQPDDPKGIRLGADRGGAGPGRRSAEKAAGRNPGRRGRRTDPRRAAPRWNMLQGHSPRRTIWGEQTELSVLCFCLHFSTPLLLGSSHKTGRSGSVGHFLRTVQYIPSFSVPCSCVCSRLTSPSVSSWHKQDNTSIFQSQGHIQRRTPQLACVDFQGFFLVSLFLGHNGKYHIHVKPPALANMSQLLPIFCEPQNRIKPVGIRPSTTKDGFSSGS